MVKSPKSGFDYGASFILQAIRKIQIIIL